MNDHASAFVIPSPKFLEHLPQNPPYMLLIALLVSAGFAGCRRKEPPAPPVATPSVTLSRAKVPLGAPVDITYRFAVAPDAPAFTENNRVFVHVVDTDEKLMWTDDHDPPTPTTQWKPGQTIEYVRTVFIPVRPYIGGASIHLGLLAGLAAASDAGRSGRRPACLQRGKAGNSAAKRSGVYRHERRLALGGDAAEQRPGRMELDEQEPGDDRVQESEEGRGFLPGCR